MQPTICRRALLPLAATALGAPWAPPAAAQAPPFPSRPVRLVVPFPPGGVTDAVARTMAAEMAVRLGQPVVVDNRPGATGQVGIRYVLSEPADGHTVLFANGATHGTLPAVNPRLPYDAAADFAGVLLVATSPLALVVGAKSPLRSLEDVAAAARRRPGSLNYASGGLGTGSHLAGALLADRLGVELEHVPYQSTAQALAALAAGDVQLFFDAAGVKPLIEGGQIRPIASTGRERWFLLPDTPTFAEAGQPDLAFESWYAFMVRAGTPAPVAARLHEAAAQALAAEPPRRALAGIGFKPAGGSPADLMAYAEAERAKWREVVRRASISLE